MSASSLPTNGRYERSSSSVQPPENMRTEWVPEQVAALPARVPASLFVAAYGSGDLLMDRATGETRR